MEAGRARGVQLGFVEAPRWRAAREADMPNKVGGQPVWLDPRRLPSSESLSCARCGALMCLLLQIYAPLSEFPRCYHRTLYLFCCKNGSCHATLPMGSFKVLRSQLARENPFYKEKDGDLDPDESLYDFVPPFEYKLCQVCGMSAPKRCSKCKSTNYCSREHQLAHWRWGHKEECGQTNKRAGEKANADAIYSLFFKEMEIVTEEEDNFEDDGKDDKGGGDDADETTAQTTQVGGKGKEKQKQGNASKTKKKKNKQQQSSSFEERAKALQAKYEKLLKRGKVDGSLTSASLTVSTTNGELDGGDATVMQSDIAARCVVDRAFIEFQARTERAQDQVLRYARWPGARPLWVSKEGQAEEADVAPCGKCGSPRTFEFQVMPQLLHFLDADRVEREGIGTAMDWGTLVVYTCAASCDATEGGYQPEFVWRQLMASRE